MQETPAFVPGVEFDVFISYAWADNHSGWVTEFEKALKERVYVLLGKEPKFWRDAHQLSGEQKFTDEIKRSLAKSASMVLILSPAYFGSTYCAEERSHFEDVVEGGTGIGNRLKLLKAIKLPDTDGLDRALLKGATGFAFHTDPPEEKEFSPGEPGFTHSIEKLARGAKSVLEEIRNSRQPIYLSEGVPSSILDVWTKLRNELERGRFRVLPRFRATENDFDPEVFRPAIKECSLAVHLIGSVYSKFAAQQVRMSLEHNKPSVIWMDGQPDSAVEKLIAESLTAKPVPMVLRGVSAYMLGENVKEKARAIASHQAAIATQSAGPLSVYLICDRTDPEDTAEAVEIARQIKQAGAYEVELPESGRDPAILEDKHRERLTQCDAVLFYVSRAQEGFFFENYADVLRSIKRRTLTPYRTLGLMLGPQATRQQASLARLDLPVLDSVEPFLAQLAASREAK
jgi:hypothetical protein